MSDFRPGREPKHPAVYRLRAADGTLLYVGASLRTLTRIAGHAGTAEWFRDVATVEIEHVASREDAFRREAEVIAAERPIHNIDPGTIKAASEDELAARRAERKRVAEEFQRRWEAKDPELMSRGHYRVPGLHCTNCGWTGSWVPKGRKVAEAQCANCKLQALEGEAA